MSLEDEKAGVDTDFIDIFRGFDGDIGPLVVNIGGERDGAAVSLLDLRGDLFEASGFAEAGGGDTDDLASDLVEADDLFDAGVDVACLLGDHGLDHDGVPASHDNVADSDGPGLAPRIFDHVLSLPLSGSKVRARIFLEIWCIICYMPKADRHAAIRALILEHDVHRQSDIVDYLAGLGFEVTQSSVSRDLAELGVEKFSGHYTLIPRGREVVSVLAAGPNMVVVRTQVGAAQKVAFQLDSHPLTGVAGTVAGDDTIFIALSDADRQAHIMQAVRDL